ncbi:MAG: hypothetical protein H7289_12520 [Mucilaginibacter sp.]|nr:hypothetical protein [Mucilaginibacter sp.]
MKKKNTSVLLSDKADNPELQNTRINGQKTYRDHKPTDYYTHSRANKYPFGSSNGPSYF